MTFWAKKKCTLAEWDTVQEFVGELQHTLAAPHDLMMLTVPVPGSEMHDIIVGLPQHGLLLDFVGFEEIGRADIPDGLSIAVCRNDGFDDRFPDIAAKAGRVKRL